jgi:hypothetical protein
VNSDTGPVGGDAELSDNIEDEEDSRSLELESASSHVES